MLYFQRKTFYRKVNEEVDLLSKFYWVWKVTTQNKTAVIYHELRLVGLVRLGELGK